MIGNCQQLPCVISRVPALTPSSRGADSHSCLSCCSSNAACLLQMDCPSSGTQAPRSSLAEAASAMCTFCCFSLAFCS